MKLSACMIVKNEEEALTKTLPGLSKHVDEIILVDTGSQDNTIALAKKYGARVFNFDWIDDFSAARNVSLQHAEGDWILWIDADEALLEKDLISLRKIIEDAPEDLLSVTIWECDPGKHEKKKGSKRPKVFRNKRGFYFIRPINEQLVNAKGQILPGKNIDVDMYHWGRHLEKIKMDEKCKRYVRQYKQMLEQNPKDPYVHYLLANNLNGLKRSAEALKHCAVAFAIAPDKKIGKQAQEMRLKILLAAKKIPEAVKQTKALLKIDPQNLVARNTCASINLITGKIDVAIQILKETLNIKMGQELNVYQSQAMPNFLLGKAYSIKGEKEQAQACLKRAQEISSHFGGGK